jgi:drug/metabolite transporter (DMT)-like permease
MLFLYAVAFSFAYIRLSTATGALILFGTVQTTMVVAALSTGERLRVLQWTGLFIALSGLGYLMFPGLTAPSPGGFALMAVAGISWGLYSLLGRNSKDPLGDTTRNFSLSVPLILGVSLLAHSGIVMTWEGALLAAVSGSLASGMGYVVWYVALGGLTPTQAAAVQLSVPVLAAAGGILFLSEPTTIRMVLASAMILGGIGLTLIGREHRSARGAKDNRSPPRG